MAEWQQLLQSVIFGIVFSFFLAKLFSVIFAFREDNLRIARSHSVEAESEAPPESEPAGLVSETHVLEENEPFIRQEDAKSGDVNAVDRYQAEIEESDDDDWEGVEITELDETFSAATVFVAATAADRSSLKVSNEVQLQLYGLYKIATEGPCTAPQPSPLKMTARAKWQAWQKLGSMPIEEAMQKYIDIVTELYPSWAAGSSANESKNEGSSDEPASGSSGPMGPVFSTLAFEEEPGSELKMDAIHGFAREGDGEKVLKCIESGIGVNLQDSEGRTPLHWAVDRGHLNISELLLKNNADINAKDNEGQTALHYAAICERSDIAKLLVENGADIEATDNEGNAPKDICASSWSGSVFRVKSLE
ncbi:hypothetical protein M569_04861 [Genlisea aurea]|uniref:ACB domain-containing protein n=1 Tax=Genlisea aurea TaxID=192259 RepID=S8EBL0_9LAMI|nr:hypothetical protein M569_04861 [Genlisea aurea]